jgi:hypothetical protein
MKMDLNCLKTKLISDIRLRSQTNLCISPDSVCISGRGEVDIEAINLNELLNIISDDSGLESIHLGIILEYVGKEGNVLWARVSRSRSMSNIITYIIRQGDCVER